MPSSLALIDGSNLVAIVAIAAFVAIVAILIGVRSKTKVDLSGGSFETFESPDKKNAQRSHGTDDT